MFIVFKNYEVQTPPVGRNVGETFRQVQALSARVKLHSKFVWERFVTAIKIDRIPYFDAFRLATRETNFKTRSGSGRQRLGGMENKYGVRLKPEPFAIQY